MRFQASDPALGQGDDRLDRPSLRAIDEDGARLTRKIVSVPRRLGREHVRLRWFAQGDLDEPEAAVVPDAAGDSGAEDRHRLCELIDRKRLQRMPGVGLVPVPWFLIPYHN